MEEKYYKPILKEGEHLVRSKENPQNVRGLSRDEDNKNPNIPEFEEVSIPENNSENELKKMECEKKCVEHQMALAKQETVNSFLQLANTITVFLYNNPEVVKKLNTGWQKVKKGLVFVGEKVAFRVKQSSTGSKKSTLEKDMAEEIESIVEQDTIDEDDREEMSIDEARGLIINILADYMNMKRNIDRISKAKINDVDMPRLDMKQILAFMDSIIEKYPLLMDEKTSLSVLDILRENSSESENKNILEVLKIEQ